MPWSGYYVQCGNQHPMKFDTINIQTGPSGQIAGKGADDAGQFNISGSFSPSEPLCRFVKEYQQHSIYYEGRFNNGTGTIDGFWGY